MRGVLGVSGGIGSTALSTEPHASSARGNENISVDLSASHDLLGEVHKSRSGTVSFAELTEGGEANLVYKGASGTEEFSEIVGLDEPLSATD